MQAIKSRNTKPERLLASALWQLGLRFRRANQDLPGKPDFAMRKYRIAVFVDGEFWHGRDWENARHRIGTNRAFWQQKIESNMARDRLVTTTLEAQGWLVLRFWDKEILKHAEQCAGQILQLVNKRKSRKAGGQGVSAS